MLIVDAADAVLSNESDRSGAALRPESRFSHGLTLCALLGLGAGELAGELTGGVVERANRALAGRPKTGRPGVVLKGVGEPAVEEGGVGPAWLSIAAPIRAAGEPARLAGVLGLKGGVCIPLSPIMPTGAVRRFHSFPLLFGIVGKGPA